MKRRGIWIVGWLCLAAVCCRAGNDRALLVGISCYPLHSGWMPIHADNDLALLAGVLDRIRFPKETRRVLRDEEATYGAIVGELRRLADEAAEGDRVWIHFSCHGQQMEDDNGDEPDGLDEALVPYDARMYYRKGVYEGEKHLRDDELERYLNVIRRKLGESGMLRVSLDACHSGSATRGEEEDVFMRGAYAIFSADPGFLPPEVPKGHEADVPLAKEKGMSPLTVVSACRADQNNYEYRAEDGKWYGTLTYAISRTLSSGRAWPEPQEWIRALKKAMNRLTDRQRPVFETTQE